MPIGAEIRESPGTHAEDRQRRVAAVAAEIARELGLSPDQLRAVEAVLLDPESPAGSDERVHVVLDLAEAVDQALHGATDQEWSFSNLLAELWSAGGNTTARFAALSALDRMYERYSLLVLKTPPRLGVCPAVMMKALSLLANEDAKLSDVEKVAECDPVLTASLLRYANSAMLSRGGSVNSTRAAISRIGFDAARRVIVAASSRPLFETAALKDLWRHSVDVAAIAQQIASTTEVVDPSEAFVAGLIHDLGRLAVEMVNDADFLSTHHRLARDSECTILADFVLVGQDHGHIGAAILSIWGMSVQLIDAVRHHHRPEFGRSVMSSIIYLAECASNSREDIPVPSRFETALRTVGLDSLESVTSDAQRLTSALAVL